MQSNNQLAFRAPALAGVVLLLAGCYTMFSHPETDIAESFRDSRYQDCAGCHQVGFEGPLTPDPYGYVSFPFLGFYDCPWWVDCGSSSLLGAAEGGAGGQGAKPRTREDRYLGSRGGTRPTSPSPTPPPSPTATPAGANASGDDAAAPKTEEGQQPGRTLKKDSPESKDPKPETRDDRRHDPDGGGR